MVVNIFVITAFVAPKEETIIDNSILLAVNRADCYVEGVKGQIDDTNAAVTPIIVNQRTLVPVRFLAESLRMNVQWNQQTQTATLDSGNHTIQITVGSTIMYVNNETKTLDTAAQIREGRILVPLRAISEALDKDVYYYNGLIIVGLTQLELNTADNEVQALLTKILLECFPHSDAYAVNFSANIGEVNGVTYACRETPGIAILPVDRRGHIITEFAVYDGYIYYILSTPGSSDFSCWLYRCKTDFTGEELLDTMKWENYNESKVYITRKFAIVNGTLYYDTYSQKEAPCFNLKTLQRSTSKMPKISITDNGKTYSRSNTRNYSIIVYANQYIFTKTKNHHLYLNKDDGNHLLLSKNACYLEGGIANGYLYFVTTKKDKAVLNRVPLTGGNVEEIDSHIMAGGGYYFNY